MKKWEREKWKTPRNEGKNDFLKSLFLHVWTRWKWYMFLSVPKGVRQRKTQKEIPGPSRGSSPIISQLWKCDYDFGITVSLLEGNESQNHEAAGWMWIARHSGLKWSSMFWDHLPSHVGCFINLQPNRTMVDTQMQNKTIKEWRATKVTLKYGWKDPNRHFFMKMSGINKYMQKYSVPLIVSKMQIKTTVRYQLLPLKEPVFQKITQ